MKKPFSIHCHYLLPQHFLSRLAGKFAHSTNPKIKNAFINYFLRRYPINMAEAAEPNPNTYATFSDFFTRALKPGARPIDSDANSIVSPADGEISELGNIYNNKLIQAKGVDFDLHHLLGKQQHLTPLFSNGKFATIYLAPKDYHRVHMPLTGQLREMIYVPGELFSVNFLSSQHVPNLFARNERVIAIFDTAAGPMAVILVGAMIVANIHTKWAGQIAPGGKREIISYKYEGTTLEKGAEMGHFTLGSTVIVLFGENQIEWQKELMTHSVVKVGEKIGVVR